jgi:8-amino-7-oxononanoate synthase
MLPTERKKSGLDQLVKRRGSAGATFFDWIQRAGLIRQIVQISSDREDKLSGRHVINFADSDYLGLSKNRRVSAYACIGAKRAGISIGMPRVLAHDEFSNTLEIMLAHLVEQEKALIFPSTTHIAHDILPILSGKKGVIFIDSWAYPINREGAYAAVRQGARMVQFAHNDPGDLEEKLKSFRKIRDKVILCDGVYSAGGGKAVLNEFSILAERYGAVIYIDDAHGIGLFGKHPGQTLPYGLGGGGTPLYEKIPAGNYLYVASLSKAFGVPCSFIAGPSKFINFVSRSSKTFVHNSQPAIPVVAAAIGSLKVHRTDGDRLREKLAQRVKQFILGIEYAGIQLPMNEYFPIQSIYFHTPRDALVSGMRLRKMGVWPLVQIYPPDYPGGGVLRFVITVKHSKLEIQRTLEWIGYLAK